MNDVALGISQNHALDYVIVVSRSNRMGYECLGIPYRFDVASASSSWGNMYEMTTEKLLSFRMETWNGNENGMA